ncbi:MAG: hypothetical protein M1831_006503 [Alyxoria varia]|nr:MAG: hypothetical protein M1831_006503 [Alyxoria varia]
MRINDINEDPSKLPFEEHERCRPGYVGGAEGKGRHVGGKEGGGEGGAKNQALSTTDAQQSDNAIPIAAEQTVRHANAMPIAVEHTLRQASGVADAPVPRNNGVVRDGRAGDRPGPGAEGERGNTKWRISPRFCTECEKRGRLERQVHLEDTEKSG